MPDFELPSSLFHDAPLAACGCTMAAEDASTDELKCSLIFTRLRAWPGGWGKYTRAGTGQGSCSCRGGHIAEGSLAGIR